VFSSVRHVERVLSTLLLEPEHKLGQRHIILSLPKRAWKTTALATLYEVPLTCLVKRLTEVSQGFRPMDM
jgi:hypothetical protein